MIHANYNTNLIGETKEYNHCVEIGESITIDGDFIEWTDNIIEYESFKTEKKSLERVDIMTQNTEKIDSIIKNKEKKIKLS